MSCYTICFVMPSIVIQIPFRVTHFKNKKKQSLSRNYLTNMKNFYI